MTDSTKTEDFRFDLESMKVPSLEDALKELPVRNYEVTDVDSYERNKTESLVNIQSLCEKLDDALEIALKLANDSNNVNALGKIADIARVYLDANAKAVEITRDDVKMKEEKERAKSREEGSLGAGSGPVLTTKEIMRTLKAAKTG